MSSKEYGGPFSLGMVLLCCLWPLGIYMTVLCLSVHRCRQLPHAEQRWFHPTPGTTWAKQATWQHSGETFKKGIKCQTEGGGGNKIQWERAEGIPQSEKEEVHHGRGCIPCRLMAGGVFPADCGAFHAEGDGCFLKQLPPVENPDWNKFVLMNCRLWEVHAEQGKSVSSRKQLWWN